MSISLSRRVAGLEESATLALNARAKELAAQGRQIYNLTAGELDGSTPDFIQKVVTRHLDQNKYSPTAGTAELRTEIAKYENRRLGLKIIEPQNIVTTTGAKTALYAVLQVLLNAGDEVIVPTPAWVSYSYMIELSGGKVVPVVLADTFDLDPKALNRKISKKTKAIIINSPHNPTGAVFSKKSLTALAKSIKGKDIVVISDDIYTTLTYGQKVVSIIQSGVSFDQTIIVNGFSKSQALTGWRIGYLAAPSRIANAVTAFLSHSSGNAPVLAQLAALTALKKGNHQTMIKEMTNRHKMVVTGLAKIPKIKLVVPGGAFYFFIDVREITKNTLDWCQKLLEQTGVALVPGEAFFAPGYVRLSFAANDETIKAALQKLKEFISSNA